MSDWSSWSSGCDSYGYQTRTRTILEDPFTNISVCPDTIENRVCAYSSTTNDCTASTTTSSAYSLTALAMEAEALSL